MNSAGALITWLLAAPRTGPVEDSGATAALEAIAGTGITAVMRSRCTRDLTTCEQYRLQALGATAGHERRGMLYAGAVPAAATTAVLLPHRVPAAARDLLGITERGTILAVACDVPLGRALRGLGVRREPLALELTPGQLDADGDEQVIRSTARLWLGGPVALVTEHFYAKFLGTFPGCGIRGDRRRPRPAPWGGARGLLPERVPGRPGHHDRHHRAPGYRAVAARRGRRPAMGRRRLHRDARQPADVLRVRRGQDRPPSHPSGRPVAVRPGLLAVQPVANARLPGRLPRGPGRRGVDAQPVRARDHHQRIHLTSPPARAIGVWDGAFGLSMALGPVLGGILIGLAGWRAVFWATIPAGLLALFLTALFTPESRAPHPRCPDPAGQAMVIVLLAALATAIIEGPDWGWASPQDTALFMLTAAALAALLYWEPRQAEPLVQLGLFRSSSFAAASLTALCAVAALAGFGFLTTLYLQDVRGMSALRAGLTIFPMAADMAVCAPLSGRLIARRGPRIPAAVAGAALAISSGALTRLTASSSPAFLSLTYSLFGLGSGLISPVITHGVMSAVPAGQAGIASGMNSSSRQLGQCLGVAVIGTVLAGSLHGPVQYGFLTAARAGWWVMAGCGFSVLLAGLAGTSGRPAAQRRAPHSPGRHARPRTRRYRRQPPGIQSAQGMRVRREAQTVPSRHARAHGVPGRDFPPAAPGSPGSRAAQALKAAGRLPRTRG